MQKYRNKRSVLPCILFSKVSDSSDLECVFYYGCIPPPAVEADPTTQTSAPVWPLSSLLKRAPTCLFSDSKVWSSACPVFALVLCILGFLSCMFWGTECTPQFITVSFTGYSVFCFKTNRTLQSHEKVFCVSRFLLFPPTLPSSLLSAVASRTLPSFILTHQQFWEKNKGVKAVNRRNDG